MGKMETQFIVSHKSLGFILSLPPEGRSQDGQRPHPETQVATQQHVKHMAEEINGRSLRRLRHRIEDSIKVNCRSTSYEDVNCI